MGWWESFNNGKDIISSYIWYIENEIESWVKSWAEWAASNADRYFDILYYSWGDVKDYAVSAAASAYELLDDKIDDAKDYARDKANEAYNNAVSKANVVANELSSFRSSINTTVNSLSSRIDSLSGVVGDIDIPGAATVRSWLASDFTSIKKIAKDYTDAVKSELMLALNSADSIAGAARAKLIKDLEAVVSKVEKDALAARNSIKTSLNSAITALETSSKAARVVLEKSLNNAVTALDNSSKAARTILEKSLNNAIDALEREAKEAREVLEGTLIQIIEGVEDALETALTDLERRFKGLLDLVINRVDILEGWIDNFAAIFDKELNKYQSRVVTWIVDGFEGILDRVFK